MRRPVPSAEAGGVGAGARSFSLLRLRLFPDGVRDLGDFARGDFERSLGDFEPSLGDLALGDLERSDLAVPGGSSDAGVPGVSEAAFSGVSGLSTGSC